MGKLKKCAASLQLMRQRKTSKMNTKKRKNRITLFKTRASLYSKLKIEFLLDFSLRTCFHCVYFGQLFDSVLPWVEITLAHLNFKSNTIVLSPSHTLSTYYNTFLGYLFVPFSPFRSSWQFQPEKKNYKKFIAFFAQETILPPWLVPQLINLWFSQKSLKLTTQQVFAKITKKN